MSCSKFRLQYVSDLHLERYNTVKFENVLRPAAPYLALAGDIGQSSHELFDDFLKYCSQNWIRVFYVAGNHEYYNKHMLFHDDDIPVTQTMTMKTSDILKAVEKYRNIHFFTENTPSVFLHEEKVAIVGQTLWTEIATSKHKIARKSLNDYSFIAVTTETGEARPLLPEDVNAMHQKQRSVLKKELMFWREQQVPVCVITHHMPSFELIAERYQTDPVNFCFASSCDELIATPVKAWIYGHTHNCDIRVINGVICAINARGYPREHTGGFNSDVYLEF